MAGNVKDKEGFQRLNFLHQAAHCVLASSPGNVELARFYTFTQNSVARRLVLRQDPSVKRTMCRRCCSLLVPGVTARVRQRKNKRRQRATSIQCLSCGQTRKLPNNPDHELWVDKAAAQLENQSPREPAVAAVQKNEGAAAQGPTTSCVHVENLLRR
ncbi:ribonuclease P protein subunit p21 [Denticeps clupeoides]|uniref:Uncharacterized protein n=1 Tax=Denticeps clupeoides TaxID=299321 RepID=A0AAY4C253_9TELE|nr:ribonuclease P protein subunit p21 [Denticeps clupeoides]